MEKAEQRPPSQPDPRLVADATKAIVDSVLTDRKIRAEVQKELFKSVIDAGQHALRVSLAINGGAAVAVLAFLGNLMTKSPATSLGQFPTAMLFFVSGVLAAAIATGCTYLTQHWYHHDRKKHGDISNLICIGLVVSSYALFAIGAWVAFQSFQR